ncbi:MAG: hypothetical protein FWD73_11650, partial [Polyangiaceae bacterium]|nr:hypothetical protein [Polyangiaceae bacterium]
NAIKRLVVLLTTIACVLAVPQSAHADERQNGLPALPAPNEKSMAPGPAAATPSAVQQQQPTAVVVVQTLSPPPPGYEYKLKRVAREPRAP